MEWNIVEWWENLPPLVIFIIGGIGAILVAIGLYAVGVRDSSASWPHKSDGNYNCIGRRSKSSESAVDYLIRLLNENPEQKRKWSNALAPRIAEAEANKPLSSLFLCMHRINRRMKSKKMIGINKRRN